MSPEPRQKPGRSKQDYGTPPELLEAVKARLGIPAFDCDLAASFENRVTHRFLDRQADALSHPWDEGFGWNWLNPPFSGIGSWVKKAYQEEQRADAQTAVLVPAAVGSNWWRDWVHEKAFVLFLNPRLTFVGCKDPYPKDCALLLYGGRSFHWPHYDVWTWKETKSAAIRSPVGERVDPLGCDHGGRR